MDVTDIYSTQKRLESALQEQMEEFRNRLNAVSPPVLPEASQALKQLSEDFHGFSQLMMELVKLLGKQIVDCTKSIDSIEAYQRRKVLLLTGVPELKEENVSHRVVEIISGQLGVAEVSAHSFRACHRLGIQRGERARPILVRFKDITTRSATWRHKTKLKGSGITVVEFLTKTRQELFVRARKHFGMRNVWSADGAVFIKSPDGNRAKVSTVEELDTLTSRFPNAETVTDKVQQIHADGGQTTVQHSLQAARPGATGSRVTPKQGISKSLASSRPKRVAKS